MTDIESVKNAQRLHHILQAIQRIHRSVGELSYEMFMADEDKQGNVVRCLEIIGEAANHVSEEICAANPEIPWAAIIGMRNNLIHGYNEVNYSLVWATDGAERPESVGRRNSADYRQSEHAVGFQVRSIC